MLPRGNILNLYSTRDKILAINIATEIAPVRTTRQTMTPMRSTDFMSKTQQLNISSLSTAKSSATGTRRGSSTDLFQQQQKKERPFSATVQSFDFKHVKPRLIEQGVQDSPAYARLSEGFKRLFSADGRDRKMVIPISGYGGHRRGDRSQNFFGKT
jgi:hypothetical protein